MNTLFLILLKKLHQQSASIGFPTKFKDANFLTMHKFNDISITNTYKHTGMD